MSLDGKLRDNVKRSVPPPEGKVRLNVNLEEDLHLRLKVHAAKLRRSVSSVVADWIRRNCAEV